ncbi:MAG: hypothetical protein HYW89_03125 [Candidatus Sungiibacteriota bacterium]|uniref:Uncharacterized protein n=1 Tax=Candidatus Sungiibacteriota bacterium TaxID=2750080 RepID=A0A7T5UQA2_9BACT|nr:MAG: hypothetical protein HYW89_03125 [Candidatus Sungbacteria bacterium]
MQVEITCPWFVESVEAMITFIQQAIEKARGPEVGGKYTPERLGKCAFLKEVIGGRLLEPDEYITIHRAVPDKEQ